MASSNQPTMDQPNASTTDSKIPSQSISASCSASARAAEHLVVGRSEGARRAHSLSPRQSRRTKASNPRRPHSLKERRKPIGDITNVTNTDDNVFAKPVSVPKKVRNKKAIGRRSPRHADRASLSRSLQHEEAGHNSSDSPHTEETSEDTESSPSLTSYSEETAQEGRPREAYYEDVTAASSSLEDPAYSQVQTSIFSLRATSSTCISIAQDPTELAAAPGHHCYRCIFRQSTRARPVCHLCLKLNPRSREYKVIIMDSVCLCLSLSLSVSLSLLHPPPPTPLSPRINDSKNSYTSYTKTDRQRTLDLRNEHTQRSTVQEKKKKSCLPPNIF